MGYLHYLHGVNPLGFVYLTNMKSAGASHSANTMFHNWFAYSTRWERASGAMPGPPPGYLVGGPNPHYSTDKCCAAAFWNCRIPVLFFARLFIRQQQLRAATRAAGAKVVREFNEGWRRISR